MPYGIIWIQWGPVRYLHYLMRYNDVHTCCILTWMEPVWFWGLKLKTRLNLHPLRNKILFPFDIQWWYILFGLPMTKGGPLLVLRKKFRVWTLQFTHHSSTIIWHKMTTQGFQLVFGSKGQRHIRSLNPVSFWQNISLFNMQWWCFIRSQRLEMDPYWFWARKVKFKLWTLHSFRTEPIFYTRCNWPRGESVLILGSKGQILCLNFPPCHTIILFPFLLT